MNEPDQRRLINAYIDAYNEMDVKGMLQVLHPEVEFKNFTGDEVTATASGIDEFKALAEQTRDLFTSRHQTLKNFRRENDKAIIDIVFEGVLEKDLPNGLEAGQLLRMEGTSEFSFRDGLIDRIIDKS